MATKVLRAAPVLAVAGIAAVVVAGSPATAKTTERLRAVERGDELRFSKSKLTPSAGKVTVVLRNPSGNDLPHAVEVEGRGIEKESDTVKPGETARVTVRLKKGRTYEFYCPVGDHRDRGMKGRIVVKR